MTQLVMSLVVSRLDYCNAVLASLPASTIAPLQRVVQNAAARLILGLDHRSHITPALQRLRWLPVHFRIDCHFNVLHSTPSLSSTPSGTHQLQRRGLWSTLPAISSCHRSAYMDTTRPPSFLSLWPHHLEQLT